MEDFDVIIVGAGPAGLKCAEVLGSSKYKVLVLEKNPEIGKKVCAEGFSGNISKYGEIPEDIVDFGYKKIKIDIKKSKFELKSDENFAYTVSRKKLSDWQLEKLDKFNNVEVRKNSRVSKIEKGFVIVDDKKISYKFLVGADGSASIVKKYLGIKQKDVVIAIQYIIPTKIYKDFELFLDSKLFSAWYAWIFPHTDYVSIGCGCDPRIVSSKELMNNFHKWLNENKIDISKAKYEGFLIDYDYRGHKFENVFLAGDAGGFASGLTGEGMYQALVSGEEIGKMILDENYESKKIKELLKTKKQENLLLKILVKSGKFRTVIFYALILSFRVAVLRDRALKLFNFQK